MPSIFNCRYEENKAKRKKEKTKACILPSKGKEVTQIIFQSPSQILKERMQKAGLAK